MTVEKDQKAMPMPISIRHTTKKSPSKAKQRNRRKEKRKKKIIRRLNARGNDHKALSKTQKLKKTSSRSCVPHIKCQVSGIELTKCQPKSPSRLPLIHSYINFAKEMLNSILEHIKMVNGIICPV